MATATAWRGKDRKDFGNNLLVKQIRGFRALVSRTVRRIKATAALASMVQAFLAFCLVTAASAAPAGASPELSIATGHAGSVSALALSRDGRILASGGTDGAIKLWDLPAGRLLRSIPAYEGRVTSLVIFPDSTLMMSGSDLEPNESAVLNNPIIKGYYPRAEWNLQTGELIRKHFAVSGVKGIGVTPDGKSVLVDGTLYDETGNAVTRLPVRLLDKVFAISPDGAMAACAGVGGWLGGVTLWSLPEGKQLATLPHSGEVTSLAFAPDGSRLASAGEHAVYLWDTKSYRKAHAFTNVKQKYHGVAYSPDGTLLAIASDTEVTVWDSSSGEKRGTGVGNSIGPLLFSADGASLLYAEQGVIKGWKFGAPPATQATGDPALKLELVKLAADRSYAEVAVRSRGTATGELRIFLDEELLPLPAAKATVQVPLHPGENLISAIMSGNGVSSRADMVVHGPPVELGKSTVRTVLQLAQRAEGVLSPDSRYLVQPGNEFVGVWDARSNLFQRRLGGHKGYVWAAAFSAGSRLLVTGAEDAVRVWRLGDGQLLATFSAEGPVTAVAISPDLRRVAALEKKPGGSTLVLWEMSTGARQPTGVEVFESDTSLQFSPDSAQLALATDQNTFLIDARTGEEIAGYLPMGRPVVYGTDGGSLTGDSGRTRIDLKSGERQDLTLRFKETRLRGELSFSDDGSWAADVAGDSIRLYRTSQPAQPAYSFPFGGTAKFSVNSRFLYVTTIGGTVHIDLQSGRVHGRYLPGQPTIENVNGAAFHADGSPIISGYRGVLRLTPEGIFQSSTLQLSDDTPEFATLLPGGDLVASARWLQPGITWSDPKSGKVLRRSESQGFGRLTGMEASPDGRLVAVARVNTWVELFDSADGSSALRFKGTDVPQSMAFSPDGAALAIGYGGGSAEAGLLDGFPPEDLKEDYRLHVRALPKGNVLRYLKGHTAEVTGVAWSSNGDQIASSGADGTLKLWNARSGELLVSVASPPCRKLRFLAKSNLLLAAGAEEPFLRLYRVPDLTLVRQVPLQETARSLAVNEKEDRLLTAETRSATLWDLPELKPAATFVAVAGNGYLVYSPDGYYMGAGASGALAFDVGGRMVPFDEFDLRFNRPDIILKRLNPDHAASVAAFEALYRKRLARHGLTAQGAESPLPLPEVRVEQWSQQEEKATLELSGMGNGEPVRAFKVWVNGVPVFGRSGAAARAGDGSAASAKLEVQLSAGVNHLEVAAVDAAGVESIRESIDLFNREGTQKPALHVLAAGVSQYEQEEHNLVFADKDATDIASLFQRQGGFRYRSVTVDIKTNSNAKRQDLLRSLEALRNVPVNDYVVIFLAGHGLLDDKLDYYFATADTDFAKPAQSGIGFSELEDALYAIPARHKVLLIDSCHAGEVDRLSDAASSGAPQGSQGNNPPAAGTPGSVVVAREVPRGRISLSKVPARQSDHQLEALLGELRRGSGASIVSASAGTQFSYESDKYRNGIFTYQLVNGVETGEADLDGDGAFNVSELRSYVGSRVAAATEGRQRPTSRGRDMVEQHIASLTLLAGSDQVHPLDTPEHSRKAAPVAAQSGGRLAAAAVGESIRLYDLAGGTLSKVVPVAPRQQGKGVAQSGSQAEKLLAVTADGSFLVTLDSTRGSVVKLSDQTTSPIDLQGAYLHAAAMAPDGVLLLAVDPRTGKKRDLRELRMWNAVTGQEMKLPQLAQQLPFYIRALHISDDHSVASAEASDGPDHNRIITWEVKTGRVLWERKSRFPLAVALSPDGMLALVTLPPQNLDGPEGEALALIETRSGKEKTRLPPRKDGAAITALSFAPDGTSAAVATLHSKLHGANLGKVEILALPGLQRSLSPLVHHGWIEFMKWGNGGASLVTSTKEGKLWFWDISSQLEDLRLRKR